MKINRTLNFGEKPLRIFDAVSGGKTQLVSKSNTGAWRQMWNNPLVDPPASWDLSEDDIYGLFEFEMVYGSFEDMSLEEQIETKFKQFWYNTPDNKHFRAFLFPLLEADPALKQLITKEAGAGRLLPTTRLKMRDVPSDKYASKVWKMRAKDTIVDAIYDALTSSRALRNLPEVRESAKGYAKLQIAMKLESGSKPSFAGVTVYDADAKGQEIKTVLKNNGVGFYRAFIVPHLSIFQNRMADISHQYNIHAATGGIVIPEEIKAMFRNANQGTVSLRNKVIRLAHSQPHLREHLLPLLKQSARLKDLGKGKYEYGGYKFEVEDGELNLISPDYHEGKNIGDKAPKFDDIIDVIVDFYDFRNRDLSKYPIEKDEIKQIKKTFNFREIEKYFGIPSSEIKQFKAASTPTPDELAKADTIYIQGYGFFIVVGVNRKEQDIYLTDESGRKEYTLSVIFGASLAGNGAELKARGNTRMRTKFIDGRHITIPL